MTLPPFPPALSHASTVPGFGAALAAYACRVTGAHGVQVWAVQGGHLEVVAGEGRGLGLSDGTLDLEAGAYPVSHAVLGGRQLHSGDDYFVSYAVLCPSG
jgi:hypothetical protein